MPMMIETDLKDVLNKLDQRFDRLDQKLDKIESDLTDLKVDMATVKAYLADAESEAATQELLAIPGLLDRVKQCEATPKTDYKNWRELRSDV